METGTTHMNKQSNSNQKADVGDLIRVRTPDSPWSDPMVVVVNAEAVMFNTVLALHSSGQTYEVFTDSPLYEVEILSKKV